MRPGGARLSSNSGASQSGFGDAPESLRSRMAHTAPYLASLALYLVLFAGAFNPETGFTGLIKFGEQFEEQRLPAVLAIPHKQSEGASGYDGQFYAQLAVQPDIRDPELQRALDSSAYRARRVLFSWSAHLLGLGRPAWILQAYALQNALCWLAMAWLLLRLFPLQGGLRCFALWFACLFNEGLIWSSARALLDGPSMLLLLLAMDALERNRRWLASAILALAGLARETNVFGASIVAWPARLNAREIGKCAGSALLIILPLGLWLAVIAAVFDDPANAGHRNFALPFASYIWKWGWSIREVIALRGDTNAVFSLLALVSFTVQWLYLALRFDLSNPWWRLGACYALLMAIVGQAVWEGNSGAVIRVVLPMAFAYNVLIKDSRHFWPLLVAGNLSVIRGVSLLF